MLLNPDLNMITLHFSGRDRDIFPLPAVLCPLIFNMRLVRPDGRSLRLVRPDGPYISALRALIALRFVRPDGSLYNAIRSP